MTAGNSVATRGSHTPACVSAATAGRDLPAFADRAMSHLGNVRRVIRTHVMHPRFSSSRVVGRRAG